MKIPFQQSSRISFYNHIGSVRIHLQVLRSGVRDAQLQQHLLGVMAAYKHLLPRTLIFCLICLPPKNKEKKDNLGADYHLASDELHLICACCIIKQNLMSSFNNMP